GYELLDRPQGELRVLVQVPGGEVGVEEGGVQLRGGEAVEETLAGPEPDDRVVLLGEGDGAGDDPDPPPAEVIERADLGPVARYDQPEPGAGIGDALGDAARRARVDRLAGDDVAAALRQAMPGAVGTGAPVELDRSAQDPADSLGHGGIQAPRPAGRG